MIPIRTILSREFATMNDIEKLFEEIKNSAPASTSASQGLDLPQPGTRQLHPAKYQLENADDTDIQDFFLLITGINEKEKSCEVIPGSFEGMMAGPDDIVLPENVLGQWAYLSLDMVTTVPMAALGNGFAKLDENTFKLIRQSIEEYKQDSSFRKLSLHRAIPYIGEFDERIGYHRKQRELLEKISTPSAQNKFFPASIAAAAVRKGPFPFALSFKQFSKAAAVLFVGVAVLLAAVMLHFGTGKMREASPPPEVFSPQGALYTATPPIAVGGSEGNSFEVTIRDEQKKLIARKTVSSGEILQWEDFTGTSDGLKENEVYSIQVSSGKRSVQKTFSLLDKSEQEKITTLIAQKTKKTLGEKIGSFVSGFGIEAGTVLGATASSGNSPEKEYEIAKILFEKGCYSEAYIKAKMLLEFDKNKEEYKKLFADCLKKLGIRQNTHNKQ